MQQQRWSRAEDAVIRRYKEQGAYKIRKQLRTLCGTDRKALENSHHPRSTFETSRSDG